MRREKERRRARDLFIRSWDDDITKASEAGIYEAVGWAWLKRVVFSSRIWKMFSFCRTTRGERVLEGWNEQLNPINIYKTRKNRGKRISRIRPKGIRFFFFIWSFLTPSSSGSTAFDSPCCPFIERDTGCVRIPYFLPFEKKRHTFLYVNFILNSRNTPFLRRLDVWEG